MLINTNTCWVSLWPTIEPESRERREAVAALDIEVLDTGSDKKRRGRRGFDGP
jgi:hypothetical protein